MRIEDTEEVLHEPLKGNEAPQRLEKRNDLETRLGDAVRGLKEGMGNTLSTGAKRNYSCIDGSRFWKWGPDATSQDAATFFRHVV